MGCSSLVFRTTLIGFIVIPIIVILLAPVGFLAAFGFILDWDIAIIIGYI